tara:strand:- start:372394 stop:373107 length:714 start_codon:yes stop_codon:yes gene_type:complete
MKNLASLLLFILSVGLLHAQKVIEKNIDYKNQSIEVAVKFASTIEVKTWDKPSIYFKADVYSEDKNYLDLYELNIDDGGNQTTITSNAIPMFETARKDCLKKNNNEKNQCYNNGDWFKFNYTIYIPKGAKFKISSINGDLKSEVIEGDFTADLINGDIDITKYSGSLDLKTINGVIDLKMINADLTAETIHGDIYADEKLKFTSSNRHVGQKIVVRTADGKNRLRLNTINGNMYLRL